MVIAHRDPGVPNWIDAAGLPTGMIFWRFLLPDEAPRPDRDGARLRRRPPRRARRMRNLSEFYDPARLGPTHQRHGRLRGRRRSTSIPFDAERLLETAIASTGGLDDFGDFDGDWRARFDHLLTRARGDGSA